MPLPRWVYAWRVRCRALLDRGRADRELDDELRDHVEREVAARCARGTPPAEARRQALAALGGLASARDRVRSVRFGALPEQALQDVRHGLRLLVRNPGFTAATVLTLTLGIGATTTVFSVVDAVLLQPPPFSDSGRLVTLWQTDPDSGQPAEAASANFLDWRAQATSFERVAAIEPYSFDVTGTGRPEVLYASAVTEGFFTLLGAEAAHGRTFRPEEYRPGSGVVVLTDGIWQRRFGRDAGIIGRSLVLDGEPYTVIGVLAPDFEVGLERGRGARDIFVPKAIAEWETFRRGDGWWHVVARLRRGVTLAEAQAEMDTVAARLAADHPRTNAGVGARVVPLQASQVEAVRPTLLLLQGLVALVLLIACINVANLMLAHGARRASEFAVRTAVGGGRGRLLRQLLTESAVVAALGGLGGLLLTGWALDADRRADAGRRAARRGDRGQRSAPGLRRRPRRRDRPGVRERARGARAPPECARGPPGAAYRRERRAIAPRAGRGRGRAGAGAARRSRSAGAELRPAGERRPRLHSGEHGGAAGVPLPRRPRRGH